VKLPTVDIPYCAECIIQRAEIASLAPRGVVYITGGTADPLIPNLNLAVTFYEGTALCTEHVIRAARERVQ
jgi:hypothetical protein